MMAGPCTVESEEQLLEAARAAPRGRREVLRGGAYKPSTSPYGFRGWASPGWSCWRRRARRRGWRW